MFSKDSPDSNFSNLEEYLQAEAARRSARTEQQSLVAVVTPERRTFAPPFANRPHERGRGQG